MDGTCAPGGTEGEARPPHLGKLPHRWRGHLGQKGRFRDYQRKVMQLRSVASRPEWDLQMFRATTLQSPAWDKCLLEWTGAEYWNMGFGEETWGEDLQRQHEEAGVRISTTRNTPEGSPDHYGSKAPLLSDVWRAEPLYP